MRGAELVGRFRFYAAKCVKISRHISDPAGKLVLLEMAQSWLKLAAKAAEAAETAPGFQTAVSPTPEGDQDRPAALET
jgi:hypothetical protein